MTKIEQVAKALFAAVQPSYAGAAISWETNNADWGEEDREGFRKSARAAIEAMRAPTDGMIVDGAYCIPDGPDEAVAANTWHVMIDAALKE